MKPDLEKYRPEFSEGGFWTKLRKIAKSVGVKLVYTALLLFYAYKRNETPHWARSIVLGALGYLLAPIDLIPDLTPLIGYTDDMTVLTLGLVTIAAYINQDVRTKARAKLYLWFGASKVEEIEEVDKNL
ncbi:MAG: YkvA family protein [Bacteroidota bacterium]